MMTLDRLCQCICVVWASLHQKMQMIMLSSVKFMYMSEDTNVHAVCCEWVNKSVNIYFHVFCCEVCVHLEDTNTR